MQQEKDEYELYTFIQNSGLKIQLKYTIDEDKELAFIGTLQSLENEEKLNEYFESLQDLQTYILKPKNIIVDLIQQNLKIIARVNSEKNKQIQLGKIKICLKQQYQQINLNRMIDKCDSEVKLQESQNKKMLKQIAEIIRQFCKTSQKNKNYLKKLKISSTNHSETNTCLINDEIIKNQIQILKWQANQTKKIFQQEYDIVVQQIKQLNHRFNSQVTKQICKIAQQFSKIFVSKKQNQKIIQTINIINQNYLKIQKKLRKFKNKKQIIELSDDQDQSKNDKKINLISIEDWIDSKKTSLSKISLTDNIIKAKQGTEIYGIFNMKSLKKFSIKIHRIIKSIGIGIYGVYQHSGSKSMKTIAYFNNGQVNINGKLKLPSSIGYYEGQSVIVLTNFNQGTIEWKINEKTRHKILQQELLEEKYQWFPYILLSRQGDKILVDINQMDDK